MAYEVWHVVERETFYDLPALLLFYGDVLHLLLFMYIRESRGGQP